MTPRWVTLYAIGTGCVVGSFGHAFLASYISTAAAAQQVIATPPKQVTFTTPVVGQDTIRYQGTDLNAVTATAFYTVRVLAQLEEQTKLLRSIQESSTAVRSNTESTKDLLEKRVVAFNDDMRRSIASRMDSIPTAVVTSAAMAEFRLLLIAEIDAKIAAIRR
jgi:hypothetical protein